MKLEETDIDVNFISKNKLNVYNVYGSIKIFNESELVDGYYFTIKFEKNITETSLMYVNGKHCTMLYDVFAFDTLPSIKLFIEAGLDIYDIRDILEL